MKLVRIKTHSGISDYIKIEDFKEVLYIETLANAAVSEIVSKVSEFNLGHTQFREMVSQFTFVSYALFNYCVKIPYREGTIKNNGKISNKHHHPMLLLGDAFSSYIYGLQSRYFDKGVAYIRITDGFISYFLDTDEFVQLETGKFTHFFCDDELVDSKDIITINDNPITLENFEESEYYMHG